MDYLLWRERYLKPVEWVEEFLKRERTKENEDRQIDSPTTSQ